MCFLGVFFSSCRRPPWSIRPETGEQCTYSGVSGVVQASWLIVGRPAWALGLEVPSPPHLRQWEFQRLELRSHMLLINLKIANLFQSIFKDRMDTSQIINSSLEFFHAPKHNSHKYHLQMYKYRCVYPLTELYIIPRSWDAWDFILSQHCESGWGSTQFCWRALKWEQTISRSTGSLLLQQWGASSPLSPTTYPAVFSCAAVMWLLEKWFGSVLRRQDTPIPQISMSDNISDTGIGGDTLLIWKGLLRSWSVEVLRSEVCVAQMRCHSSLWLSTYLGLFSDKGNICLCHRLQKSTTRSLQYWYWHN